MSYKSGRHFLQIPGPSNVPDRVLRAIDRPIIDHRGPEFAEVSLETLAGLKGIFNTSQPVIIYPGSGTGAWEASLVNTLSPGDKVLMFETGQFAAQWRKLADRMGLDAEFIPGDWRNGVDPAVVESRLAEDKNHSIKAVGVVHTETSTGVKSRVSEVRKAMDAAGHPALLLVDAVSTLGCTEFRHDDWGVDVTVSGSQKGLMLPPGLSFTAVSEKALSASKTATLPRHYWNWDDMLAANEKGFFPYTPATNMIFGLREAILMLNEEGMENVFIRHQRYAEATRRAVKAWGLEVLAQNPAEYSTTLTAVMMPDGHDADDFRQCVLENFDMSLGVGLGKIAGKVFRIGHLGHFNDLSLAGTLSGVEMGLKKIGLHNASGGVTAALDYLGETSPD